MAVQALSLPGIVDISQDGYKLNRYRGFLRLEGTEKTITDLAMDDIHALLISARQCLITTSLIQEFSIRGIPIVFCGNNFMPEGICLSTTKHGRVAEIAGWQLSASIPLKKQLWQNIIIQKILNQALILERINPKADALLTLRKMAVKVKSGDSQNIEAQAAKIYWRALMGKEFRRDTNQSGINAALNYGYSVVRASVARAIAAHGLLPMFGIFHSNKNNAWQLADDLMEIWRPLVDFHVYNLFPIPEERLPPTQKAEIVKVLQWDCVSDRGVTPLYGAVNLMIISLVDSFKNKCNNLYMANL